MNHDIKKSLPYIPWPEMTRVYPEVNQLVETLIEEDILMPGLPAYAQFGFLGDNWIPESKHRLWLILKT